MSRPLDGVRVVELGGIGPAPFACGVLGDLGAAVVRIERPDRGDGGLPGGLGRIGVRQALVVALNLKDSGDMALLRKMIAEADVLVESFRPGVAERLGIGPEEAMSLNPSLVYARVTGWGQSGPYASMAGHDINYIGLSGVLASVGTDRPTPPLNLVADYGGGAMFAVTGILAALVERTTSGKGQVVEAAMVDGASALLSPIRGLLDEREWIEQLDQNLLDGGAPFYRTYRTSDGKYMAVGAIEEPFYRALLRGLELAEGDVPDRSDRSRWDDLAALFETCFSTRTRAEWTTVFDGTDACVTPVLAMSEVGSHEHNRARGLPAAPLGVANAPRMEGLSQPERPSPSSVLNSVGVSEDEVAALENRGAVAWVGMEGSS